MDGYLRLSLLIVAFFILSYVLFESWMKKGFSKLIRFSKNDDEGLEPQYEIAGQGSDINLASAETHFADRADDFLILSVFAKPNCFFQSYDLLQAISATGMQYGDMNIFHFHSQEIGEKLFSLASATKPGEFNLDRIGNFSCLGLTLFMDLRAVSDPKLTFKAMLKTAEQLAEDLEGELRAGPHHQWGPLILQQYQRKIARFLAHQKNEAVTTH